MAFKALLVNSQAAGVIYCEKQDLLKACHFTAQWPVCWSVKRGSETSAIKTDYENPRLTGERPALRPSPAASSSGAAEPGTGRLPPSPAPLVDFPPWSRQNRGGWGTTQDGASTSTRLP